MLGIAVLMAGCDTPAAPEFHLNMVQIVADENVAPL